MAKIYSHSKIQAFEQCPLRYKYKYIDKHKPDIEKTIEAHLGSSVHDTLEWVYNTIKEGKNPPTIDEVIIYYQNKWKENFSENIAIIREGMTYEDYFNKGVKFLVDYYNKHYPFKDGTLECEKKVFIDLDNFGDYKIIGYIDRLVFNPETQEFEIHDYKTANSLPTKEKVEADRQLALYSLAIKNIYGDYKTRLVWHYLSYNKRIDSTRENHELENLKKETLEKIKQIESSQSFPPSPSILCNWCDYQKRCPYFKSKFE
ncbi:MAG TPA: PD-(D/E)XK nuclease family protein [Candidatus Nanoarchaeia archaeon]|nr:PD-(D/E)XK nuclease family protein [Candidatus Nanoarchaeia archaeon]